MVGISLSYASRGTVQELPSDEVLKFDQSKLPERSPDQTLMGAMFDENNRVFFDYWGELIQTAFSLANGVDCYAQRKAAANGEEISPFVGVDTLLAEEYSRRFTGFEEKFAFVKEQIIAMKDALYGMGFEVEENPEFRDVSMNLLEELISSMDSADFNNFEPDQVQIVRFG